jgi:hypothetical protein
LETEIVNLEARAVTVRQEIDKRPVPAKKGQCRRCGGPRPPRARLCSSCVAEVHAIRSEESAIQQKLGELRAEHAIAIRQTDDLVADIHVLQSNRPRSWRTRERVLEVEIQERFWEGLPSFDHDDAAPVSVSD